ncbi:MAG: hypothetical protein LBU28_01905 [Spirochaetaceae bacterium]|jgi:hypothetical protein|nr:hypothetical protein [Spirochaetaceae bacterium]
MKISGAFSALLILALSGIFAASCVNIPGSNAWSSGKLKAPRGTGRLGDVSVDKAMDWASVEGEIRRRLPLLFLERKYLFAPPDGEADFRVDVRAIEREYLSGWKTLRSLSMEVHIWREGDRTGTPLASGRAIQSGDVSLSSAEILDYLLREAAKMAFRGMRGIRQ